jgi:small subunit ribosomal protein S4
MMVDISTPTKKSRRLGVRFIPKLDKYIARHPYPPGGRGQRRRKLTEYGQQLLEKQKAKFFYNLRERQFRNYVRKALQSAKNSSEALIQFLEMRLDNVVFRAGFAVTHMQARQLVTHRHFAVNGRKINLPSYQVKPGDVITPTKLIYHDEKATPPAWLRVDHKINTAEVVSRPAREDVVSDLDFEQIISFYSR